MSNSMSHDGAWRFLEMVQNGHPVLTLSMYFHQACIHQSAINQHHITACLGLVFCVVMLWRFSVQHTVVYKTLQQTIVNIQQINAWKANSSIRIQTYHCDSCHCMHTLHPPAFTTSCLCSLPSRGQKVGGFRPSHPLVPKTPNPGEHASHGLSACRQHSKHTLSCQNECFLNSPLRLCQPLE